MSRRSAWLILLLVCFPVVSFSADFYEIYKKGIAFEKSQEFGRARMSFLEAARVEPRPQVTSNPGELSSFGHYDPYAHLAYCEIALGLYKEAAAHLQMSREAGITPARFTDGLEQMLKAREKQRPFAGRFRKREDTMVMEPPIVTTAEPAAPSPVPVSHESPSANEPVSKQTPVEPLPAAKPVEAPPQNTDAGAGGNANSSSTESARSRTEPKGATANSGKLVNRRRGLFAILALALICVAVVLLARRQKGSTTPVSTNILVDSLLVDRQLAAREDTPTEVLREEDMVSDSTKRQPTPTGMTPQPIPLDQALALASPLPEGRARDFGDYQLEGVLGSGGMGTTYLATRKRDGWTLAIKVPHDHLMSNQDFVRRFVREGSLGALLHHPNIVRIYESDRIQGRPFIAMELLKGRTLQASLKDRGPMSVPETLEIAREIALALDYASLKGVVHRDLKPDNIMLPDRGGLKVMDFGIARLLSHPGGTVSDYYVGTPTYSAPEASAAGGADHRADLYSLGIILYRMLSGQLPFYSKDPVAVLEMHRNQPLPPLPHQANIPDNVSALIDKLTAKDREKRYQTAESLLIDLNDILRKT